MLLLSTHAVRVSRSGFGRGRRRLRLETLETRALLAAFIVNTTDDTVDVSPGDGQAADVSGMTSLRSAVMEANALGGANTIQLQAENYALVRRVTGAPGTLAISSDITLLGAGAEATTVETTDLFRLFDVHSGASLTIDGITLTGGRAPAGANDGAFGGAIATAGQLTIRDSVVRDNVAENGGGGIWVSGVSGGAVIEGTTFENNRAHWGGALATRSGNISVTDSHFHGNSATNRGGAIQNEYGTVVITGGTVTGNFVGSSLTRPATDGSGGAVQNNGVMTLTGLTISENSAWFGGGVRNIGEMTVDSSTVSDNVSAGSGGGLSNWEGNLTVIGSTVSNNSATFGGALWSNSTAVIIDSFLRDNHVSDNGGAISNAGTGSLQVIGSTLAGNTAFWGGAVLNGTNASMTMVNSTVSGNAARNGGGGIQNLGPLTVTHSTFVGNRADTNTNGTGRGGGINSNPSSVLMRNTLVAGNFLGTQTQADDLAGVLAPTSSFNLIGDANTSGGLTDGVNGNIVGDGGVGTLPVASILDTQLSDNGGPTPTHALSRGSRAIDAAGSPGDVQQDQRGLPRPVGDASDIGAYETHVTDPGFNSSPEAVDDFYNLLAGESLAVEAVDGVLANDTDPEGDLLAALLVDAPQFGTVQLAADGSFSYTPDEGFVGVDSFAYRASDGLVESGIATVSLEVEAAEQPGVEIQIGDGSGTIDLAAPWITVVIHGSNQVDVSLIDADSLRFGATGAENSIELSGRGAKAKVVYELVDLNGDGHLDFVVRFESKRTGLSVGDSEVVLTGNLDGEPFSVTQPATVISSGGGGKGGGKSGGGGGKGSKNR